MIILVLQKSEELLFNALMVAVDNEFGIIFLSLPNNPHEIGMSTHDSQSLFPIDWPRFTMTCAVSLEWSSVQQSLDVVSISMCPSWPMHRTITLELANSNKTQKPALMYLIKDRLSLVFIYSFSFFLTSVQRINYSCLYAQQ